MSHISTKENQLLRVLMIVPVRENTVIVKTVDHTRSPVLPDLMIEACDHSLEVLIHGLDGEHTYVVAFNQHTGSPAVYELDKKTRKPNLMWEVKP